ncbi:MAG: hypothetical protein ABI343_09815, partial [Burkholderiaceae bacterium]
FACSDAPGCDQALAALQLPMLDKLLRRLALTDSDTGSASSLSPPHERALARVHGIAAADGCIPWAAHALAQAGGDPATEAWAWITPAHWDVGADHITMADPLSLDLPEQESRELLAAMQSYFAEDGIALEYVTGQHWRAHGPLFDGLATASLDRVAGREISAWMPSAAVLRRLQNEMQMLLYTHPLNDARSARSAMTVNSFWVSGTGRMGASDGARHPAPLAGQAGGQHGSQTQTHGSAAQLLLVADQLRQPALAMDWAGWTQAWAQVDQDACGQLLRALDAGQDARLTLCGERSALSFASAREGMVQRLRRRFTHTPLQSLQDQL